MNKKPYEAPKVKKVKLEVKNAILATCHSSPSMTPATVDSCLLTGCLNP